MQDLDFTKETSIKTAFGDIKNCIKEILQIISNDFPPLKHYLSKIVQIKPVKRLDRRKGIVRYVFVIEFEEVPPPLSITGSWIRQNVQAQVKGYLIGRLGLPISIDVDIQAHNFFELMERELTRTSSDIELNKALSDEIITKNSPFISYMQKYNIRCIEMLNHRIIGPDIGAMDAIEGLLKILYFQDMADLFTGTGSLIKVGLLNGVERAIGIDLDISAAKDTLSEFAGRVHLYQGDTFQLKLPRSSSFVVADPTIPLAYRFVREVVPEIKGKSKLLLFVHGHTEHTIWNQNIRKELTKFYCHIYPFSSLAMEMSFCTNNERLARSLNKLFLN